jgi:hypothetical protein
MLSYGHGTSPITMDMGCFKIFYREPHCGGNRQSIHKTRTMLSAVAEFNTNERTSMSSPDGAAFDTPLRVERHDTFGNHTDTWLMDGRYDVPRHTNGQVGEPTKTRTYKRTRRAT